MTLTRWLWVAAAVSVAAWLLVLFAFERTSHDNRYSGYGVFVVLYALVVPATVVLCAIVGTFVERARLPVAAIGIVLAALFSAYALLVTFQTLAAQAERRANARREAERYAAFEARINAMSIDQLTATLDDPELATMAAVRLTATDSIWSDPCAPSATPQAVARALALGKQLARPSQTTLALLLGRVRAACPALQMPLLDAVIDGATTGPNADRGQLALDLVRADGGGAWLRHAHERIHFTPAEQASALRNAYGDYSDEWKGALVMLRVGFVDPEWPTNAPEELVAKWRAETATKAPTK